MAHGLYLYGRVSAAITTCLVVGFNGASANAQESIVSACSGVSLPRSVVTDIMTPVLEGAIVPVEATVNPLLATVELLAGLPVASPLSIDTSGLLLGAASGDPISLSVLDVNGGVVGPSNECVATSDAISLDNERGVSIGGNRVTGLGENGMEANAGEFNSIAIGNNASTSASATGAIAIGQNSDVQADAAGSIALGQGATASQANSIALGANSLTSGALAAPAYNPGAGVLAGARASGEVSIGNGIEFRRLTNLAAGAADTDAANIAQLRAVDEKITDLGDWVLRYDTTSKELVTLEGASGTTIGNLAAGVVSAVSTEAVNGSQLHGLSQSVVNHFGGGAAVNVDGTVTGPTYAIRGGSYSTIYNAFEAVDNEITNVNTRIDNIDITFGEVSDRAVRYDGVAGAPKDTITLEGTSGSLITNLRPGLLSMASTDAVNGSQLHATNVLLAELSDHAVQYDLDIDGNKKNIVTLLGGDPSTPVVVKNVEAGVDSTDAVNVAQLEDGMSTTLLMANTYADSLAFNFGDDVVQTSVTIANQYTDFKVGQLSMEIDGIRSEARQAAAIGLAASSIRYDNTPGKLSIGMGGGFWRGEGAAAFGAGYTSESGRVRANVSTTVAGGNWGAGAGASLTLN
ncbi:YadA-like family protein [Mesorhizobium sp. 10J20-29]